jgi:hypothetical protein
VDECQQAVALGAARWAQPQVHGDLEEGAARRFDVPLEHRPRDSAAGVAVVDLEERIEEVR